MADTAQHDAAHPPEADGSTHPPAWLSMFGLLAGAIITAATIIALQGYYLQNQRRIERQGILAVEYQELLDHQAANARVSAQIGWVDVENGIVRIPVERAIEQYLSEWNGK